MWPNPQETADLITFTEEILHGKLHFLCSETLRETQLLKGLVSMKIIDILLFLKQLHYFITPSLITEKIWIPPFWENFENSIPLFIK